MNEIKVCLHCGNKTQMELIHQHLYEKEEFDVDPDGPYVVAIFSERYKFFQCPVCNMFTLECEDWDTYNTHRNGEPMVSTRTLYPSIDISVNKIPHGVKEAYQAAQKVRNIDGAICALAIRRTLEKMCKDKGAKGKDLYSKLKELSQEGIIPPILDDISLLIKDIGNEAAHADDAEFDESLIKSLLRFTDIILEYVYVLPQEIKKLQQTMSVRANKDEKVKVKTSESAS